MQTPGSQFIHERNPNLHASQEVEDVAAYLRAGGETIPNQPADKISAYLGFLADKAYVNDGILTGDQSSTERQIEAASVALTEENAEAYVKFQAKVARELGRGAEIDPDKLDSRTKMEGLRLVRKDQQKQLGDWITELRSNPNYHDWFKHWMFENVKRHTAFNDEPTKNGQPKGFEKRSGSSFALFPELDRESVSLVYDALTEKLGGEPMGFEYNKYDMRALLAKSNFGELYGEAQNYGFKITDELKEVTTGSWHDFHQSDKKTDAEALSGLVRSYRTGWCTAGSETAAVQLSGGDFYVWCSTNPQTGRDEVPRIAVRMENGSVAEVRGVVGGRRQELEPQLVDTVVDKIKDLPGGESYFQKAEDMKRLTAIERKLAADPQTALTKAEIKFLYELDHDIQGFGYDKDPRVAELQSKRGELDHPELRVLAVEHLQDSFEASYHGYAAIAEQLNAMRPAHEQIPILSESELQAAYESQLAEWQQNGVLEYVAERITKYGELHTPIATPNIIATKAELKQLARSFGEGQLYETYIYDSLYDMYSDEELSGRLDSGQPVRFSLLPNKYTAELDYKPAEQQRDILQQLRAKSPTLNLHVPSVLDGLTLWQTLRSRGDKLADGSTFHKTYIRHFDLAPKKLGRGLRVPCSYVSGDGRPYLDRSGAENDNVARCAVG